MYITMNGDLVEINQKNIITTRIPIDNQTKVQYKQSQLIVNDQIIENFTKQFINRLDYAIKHYELKLQQSIQHFICNRQEMLKINQTDKKLVTRYLWISDNYSEIRYTDTPLSKNYKRLPINDIIFHYQDIDDKIMKTLKKHQLDPEYMLTLIYKKKQLNLVFLSFRKLQSFIQLCNWILKQRELPKIQFSALLFLKYKLNYAAKQQSIPIKKYLLNQLNRIRTQYTLKTLKDKNSQVLDSEQKQQHERKWSVQLTIKKSTTEEKENIIKKIQFS